MSLLPLDWVVVDSPSTIFSSRMNGSAARVLWVSEDGWVILTFADGVEAGKNWEIRPENLCQFCPLNEDWYWDRSQLLPTIRSVIAAIDENPSQQFQ